MQVQYASDLHLEFPKNKAYIKANPIMPLAETLILAGDVVPFAEMEKHRDFISYVSDHFKATYWIPGNHEYYHSDASNRQGHFIEKIRGNVWLLNNAEVELPFVRLLFSTLWSPISPGYQWHVERQVADYTHIRYFKHRLSVDVVNAMHQQAFSFLESRMAVTYPVPTAIVSHHVPTLMHYPEKYRNSIINEAFAVELSEAIMDWEPSAWIYGHHHINNPPFTLGKTLMLTNQLGYVHVAEHAGFNHSAVLRLGA